MITFSAKDLLTKSCRQIKMLKEHPELNPSPSNMMIYGSNFQKAVADTIPGIIGQEMRGTYVANKYGYGGIGINFSNDIVCKNTIYEVKSVFGAVPDWYLKSSLLQCAFYKSMILMGADRLETASFYVNEGHERKVVYMNPHINKIRYILIFGEEKYEIRIKDVGKIIGFFEYKAACCCDNWSLASSWDFRYKHKEYEVLKDAFTYNNIF